MAQRVKGGMWCPRCGPVAAVRNTNGVRNTAGVFGTLATGGLSLLLTKVDRYVCPNCGGPVRGANAARARDAIKPVSGDGPANVTLKSAGPRKIQVIKVVRAYTRLGLKEAKLLVEQAPTVIADGIPELAAGQLKTELEAAGAEVEVTIEQPADAPDRELASERDPEAEREVSLTDELERLTELHRTGALSHDEFAAAKARVLSQR